MRWRMKIHLINFFHIYKYNRSKNAPASWLSPNHWMKSCCFLFAVAFLASCMPVQTATPSPRPTETSIPRTLEPTSTFAPPTITPTSTFTPTSTPTPCDPREVDYCITDGHFIFQRPILAPANIFVDRIYPFASTDRGTRDPHHGVEFVNDAGTPVYAVGDGTVIFAGADDVAVYSPWRIYYGNLVVIQHADDLSTLYAHLSLITVRAGDSVEAGEPIGEVGRSGVAIGSHLHFEVRHGDVENYYSAVNPELWLVSSEPDFGAMQIAVVDSESNLQKASLTIQRVNDINEVIGAFYVNTYHSSLALGDENAALGDLPAGRYRITLIFNGQIYERQVEVQSGKLTQVVIVVN